MFHVISHVIAYNPNEIYRHVTVPYLLRCNSQMIGHKIYQSLPVYDSSPIDMSQDNVCPDAANTREVNSLYV